MVGGDFRASLGVALFPRAAAGWASAVTTAGLVGLLMSGAGGVGVPWVWPLLIMVGALTPAALVLAGAGALRAATQASLRNLLAQATRLDRDQSASRRHAHALTPAAAEVSTAMQLSALALHEQLRRERSFSSDAAHQLRTPLTALRLRLEDVLLRPDLPRSTRADLESSIKEVDRLSGVITDLLDLARIGTLPGAGYGSDLAVAAVHARMRWSDLAAATGRELRLRPSLTPTPSNAGSAPVAQILDVLIDNAIRHGRGTIEISLDRAGTQARLRVSDEGTAASAAAPASRTRRTPVETSSQGQGLGLALARRLAAALGGQVIRGQHPSTAYDLLLPTTGSTPAARRWTRPESPARPQHRTDPIGSRPAPPRWQHAGAATTSR